MSPTKRKPKPAPEPEPDDELEPDEAEDDEPIESEDDRDEDQPDESERGPEPLSHGPLRLEVHERFVAITLPRDGNEAKTLDGIADLLNDL